MRARDRNFETKGACLKILSKWYHGPKSSVSILKREFIHIGYTEVFLDSITIASA